MSLNAAVKSLFLVCCLSSTLAIAKPSAGPALRPVQTEQRMELARASGPVEWVRAAFERMFSLRSSLLFKR